MLRFALAQMRTSIGRLIAAAIAIILGTAFIASSLMGTDVVEATAKSGAVRKMNGADFIVSYVDMRSAYERVSQMPGVKGVDVIEFVSLGVRTTGAQQYVQLDDLPIFGKPPKLVAGTLPSKTNEVTLTQDMASALQAKIGDTIDASSSNVEFSTALRVTGITEKSLLEGTVQLWATQDTVQMFKAEEIKANLHTNGDLLVYGDGSRTAEQLRNDVQQAAPDAAVLDTDQFSEQYISMFVGDSNFFLAFALAFAAVAIVVAGMVIRNTFEVLVAQRAQTLALMRCAGATKAQIRRSVLMEAGVLGLLSSLTGVLLGVSLVSIAISFLRERVFGLQVPSISQLGIEVFIVPIVVGLVLTVVSAIGPARLATKVSPVAALQPQTSTTMRASSKQRLILGIVAIVVGLVLLMGPAVGMLYARRLYDVGIDVTIEDYALVFLLMVGVLGGLLTVGGTLVLSPFVVPHMIRGMGAALAAVTPKNAAASIRLAAANAARNPRRTAATTSALVIGVGLVVMMATGAASARATLYAATSSYLPGDVWVRADSSLKQNTQEKISAVKHVEAVAPVWSMTASIEGTSQYEGGPDYVWIADPKLLGNAVDADIPVSQTQVLMTSSTWERQEQPSTISVDFPDAKGVRLPVKVVGHMPFGTIIPLELASQHTKLPTADSLAINVTDEKASEANNAIERIVAEEEPGAYVNALITERTMLNDVIDALLATLIGLLGVAVVIALVGVANTLTLSVIERRRENGMLRAVGVTAPQLRGMLAVEGVFIALAGIMMGVVLGMLTGVCGAAILLGATEVFVPSLDWRVLLGCIVIAILAGLLASVLPARNATKVPVVVALAN